MADWFKFYENDLDETRLQYAISKLPEVVSVWVGILSECCRHKSGTIRWGANEIELFGFSRRLGISLPKVNEGINLLCEIDYILKKCDTITVLKWGSKQSEYCQKLTKQQNQNGANHHTKKNLVGRVSGHTRDSVGQEERRGDKKRGEENTKKSSATPPEFELFWKMYPRKVAKGSASKAWDKIKSNPETIALILAAVPLHAKQESWLRDGGQFIPHPATWLNQTRWLDSLDKISKPEQAGGRF